MVKLKWTGDWEAAEDEASELAGVRADTDPIAWRILATIASRRGRSEAAATIERMWAVAHQMDEMTFIDPAAGGE